MPSALCAPFLSRLTRHHDARADVRLTFSTSVWFRLFRLLDPAEADAAAAAAPARAADATPLLPGEIADHDFYRRFVEQFCASLAACLLTRALLASQST